MWGEKLLVADAGNRRVRVVEPDGRVWTLAGNGGGDRVDGFPLQASFVRPTAIAVGPDGAIYVADGNAIRVIGRRSFAYVETIAGGSGRGFRDGNPLTAQFNRPSGLAFDAEGRLLVADSDNGLIRVSRFRRTRKQNPKAQDRRLSPPKNFADFNRPDGRTIRLRRNATSRERSGRSAVRSSMPNRRFGSTTGSISRAGMARRLGSFGTRRY